MKNKKNNSGAITLEAAIFVPIFLVLMLLVNGLFMLFMGQQIMTHALVQSAKSMAFDPYASQRGMVDPSANLTNIFVDVFSEFRSDGYDAYVDTDDWYAEENVGDVVKERFLAYIRPNKKSADDILDLVGVEGGVNSIDFSDTTVEEGVLTINLKYKQSFVYNVMGLEPIERELTLKVKLFEYIQS